MVLINILPHEIGVIGPKSGPIEPNPNRQIPVRFLYCPSTAPITEKAQSVLHLFPSFTPVTHPFFTQFTASGSARPVVMKISACFICVRSLMLD